MCIHNPFSEFFWPCLSPFIYEEVKEKTLAECKWNPSDEELILDYIQREEKNEAERNKNVESKAAIFIGSFGVAVSALLIVLRGVVLQNAFNIFDYLFAASLAIIILYLLRTIWFAIKVLERRTFYRLGFPIFFFTEKKEKRKQIILDSYNCILKNRAVINDKVSNMVMAQEYFKRAVITLGISTAGICVLFIWTNRKNLLELIQSLL